MLAAWLVFPAVALVVTLGVGLLVERAAGARLPGALLFGVGVLGLVAASQLTTISDVTAELTLPFVLVLAVAGWALGLARVRETRIDPWALAAAAGVFVVFAAPQVLSGEATFAGYTVLGDTSIHMIGADAIPRLARDFSSLPPSSYEYSLIQYYATSGYPSGGPVLAGVLTSLVHLDVAWTFQALLTLLAAGLALALWSLLEPLVASRPLRAAVVFLAAQPALVVAYVLQGSIKEIGTVFSVTTVAALIPAYALQRDGGVRRGIPLAVASAGTIGFVGLTSGVWLAPLLIGALIAAYKLRAAGNVRGLLAEVGVFLAVIVVGAAQSLSQISSYTQATSGIVQAQAEFGNLIGPLNRLQAVGIWLVGDYRVKPVDTAWTLTVVLLVVAAVAALGGVVWLIRKRSVAWPVLLYVGVSLVVCAFVVYRGSPWADGKALMIVSPAVLLTVALGAAALYSIRRFAAYAVLGLLALGVVGSNAYAYRSASVAPRDRMQELSDIGDRIDGQGLTLYTEFEEFGKHFLREGAPTGTAEGWQRYYGLAVHRDGSFPNFGRASDLDEFTDRYLKLFRTIVLRRGYLHSRPPSMFRRIHSGRYYDVWQRAPGAERDLLEHYSLGDARQPVAKPKCTDMQRLGAVAGAAGGELRYVERPENLLFIPAYEQRPPSWTQSSADGAIVRLAGPGRVEGTLDVPTTGRYSLSIEGADTRSYRLLVDGREVLDFAMEMNYPGVAEPIATLELTEGRHEVELYRDGGNLQPGNGASNRSLGPLGFAPADPGALPVRTLDPDDWRSLCGRSLDWVEAVRR